MSAAPLPDYVESMIEMIVDKIQPHGVGVACSRERAERVGEQLRKTFDLYRREVVAFERGACEQAARNLNASAVVAAILERSKP